MRTNFRRAIPVYPALIVGSLLFGGLTLPSLLTPVTAAPSGQQAATAQQAPTPGQAAFFEKNIQPILISHCYDCHSADTRSAGGLRLDIAEAKIYSDGELAA